MSEEIHRLPTAIPLPLPEDRLRDITEKAKDWALLHGAAMRSKLNFSEDTLQIAPFALIPSVFPRKEFIRAVQIQTVLNELMHRVAYDRQFLSESLKETIKVDAFTRNLFNIYEIVQQEGVAQVCRILVFQFSEGVIIDELSFTKLFFKLVLSILTIFC